MQEWVTKVLLPYAERQIASLGLRSDSSIVLLLDVWSVHKGEPFRRFLRTHHPRIHLIFIPANCTSKLQVADVALQRPFKSSISRSFDDWATSMLHQQITSGAEVSLKASFGMPVIKPLLLQWCVASWEELRQRKVLILQGWGQCVTLLYDVHDPEKRMQAVRDVADERLELVPEPLQEEEEALAQDEEDLQEDYDSDSCSNEEPASPQLNSTDEQADELDPSLPVAEGQRRSTRACKPVVVAAGSYMISSQQIAFSGDSEA